MSKVLPLNQAAPPLHQSQLWDYFCELFRPDLGDLRVEGVDRRNESAGFVPNPSGHGWSITIDPNFLHEKRAYSTAPNGKPLFVSKPNYGQIFGEAYAVKNIMDIPDVCKSFCEAHGFNYDLIADYRADRRRFIKSEAWTDANAAHINQADAMAGIIITIMTLDPEYFLTPSIDVIPEGDTTDNTPIYRIRPQWSAASSAAALLNMSPLSDGTITSALPTQQLIARLGWRITPDQMGIIMANLVGNDPMSAIMDVILKKVAQNYGGNYYYGNDGAAIATTTMVPFGLHTFLDTTNNRIAIGVANAALDATTLTKLDEAIDAVQEYANSNFLIFLNQKQSRALHEINKAQRVWETLPGLNMFGMRPTFYRGIPLVPTTNLGQAENINGTTFTGSTGASLWGVHMGGVGTWKSQLAGRGGLRIDIEKVVGQDQLSIMGIDYASQHVLHPRANFRMHGAT